jgi:hypothetical protein
MVDLRFNLQTLGTEIRIRFELLKILLNESGDQLIKISSIQLILFIESLKTLKLFEIAILFHCSKRRSRNHCICMIPNV